MSTALFIGRFQPFHQGHLWAVKKILQENDHIIIAIGSSQISGTEKNPYTAKERRDLIKKSLTSAEISPEKYTITEVPDIDDPPNWAAHVINLVPPFQKLYTGSSFTKKCFAKSDKEIIDLPRHKNISATKIRAELL